MGLLQCAIVDVPDNVVLAFEQASTILAFESQVLWYNSVDVSDFRFPLLLLGMAHLSKRLEGWNLNPLATIDPLSFLWPAFLILETCHQLFDGLPIGIILSLKFTNLNLLSFNDCLVILVFSICCKFHIRKVTLVHSIDSL